MKQDNQGRLLLALLLSIAIWMGIQMIFFPPKENSKGEENKTAVSQTEEKQKSESKIQPADIGKSTPVGAETKSFLPNPVPKGQIQSYFLETDSFIVEFSSLGGRIQNFYIQDHKDADGKLVRIAREEGDFAEINGKKEPAIELSRGDGFDFNFIQEKSTIPSSPWNGVNFQRVASQNPNEIILSATSPDRKYQLQKTFTFFPTENYYKLKISWKNLTKDSISLATRENPLYFRSYGSLGPLQKKQEDWSSRDKNHFFRFYYLGGSFEDEIDGMSTIGFFSKFTGGKEEDFSVIRDQAEGLDFAGTGSRYFIAVLDPLDHSPQGVVLDNRNNNQTGVLMVYDNLTLKPGEQKELNYASYIGIRESYGMTFRSEKLNPFVSDNGPFEGLSDKLDKSFNQGLTTPFRNGIVWILKKLHDYTIPNYGWCIIMLTILFKLLLYPLNQKQAESMKKMQALSPEIKALNEKYAKDPQTKQQKTMELYKKNQVNPMGGCLPLLIQIPIFIALYSAFSDTIELWKTPFLWIGDLSQPDTVWTSPAMFGIAGIPLNVLPLVMVVSQIFQTRMTSVSADPNQKTMMYVMPVIMLYFFWSMPAGVTLYWTVNNFFSIIQQVFTNKFGPEAQVKKGKKK